MVKLGMASNFQEKNSHSRLDLGSLQGRPQESSIQKINKAQLLMGNQLQVMAICKRTEDGYAVTRFGQTHLPFQPYIYIITYTLNLLKQIGFEDDEIAKFGICPSSSAEN